MEKRRGKLNGLMLKGLFMDFKHQKILRVSSTTRTPIENCLRLLSRLSDVLKLLGKQ
jgi:hypothetical protein